ncbi:MAG: hypothetical protein PHF50_01375 [Patescibacteria group bacterium]|nr:hypothetical protein [Patescibacteria group bacterium]
MINRIFNRTNLKFNILLALFILALISLKWSDAIMADNTLAQKLKGKILLQVEENGEAWYVFPADLKRYYLGRPADALNLMKDLGLGITNADLAKISAAKFDYANLEDSDNDGLPDLIENALKTDPRKTDSDGDGHNDGEEIYNDYNPLGNNKIAIDKTLSKNLAGQILIQIESAGEAWYVNPDNLKRYYLGRPIDALNLMKKIGLGITNENLAKIDKLIVKPENTNDYIVKNYTSAKTDGTRIYQEPNNLYSFAYPNNWKIKKFDASPDEVQLSDANRDFIEEEKAVITIHKFSTASSTEVGQFKIAVSGSQVMKKQEKDFEVANKPAFETSYLYPLAFQKTALIQIDDKNFLRVSLTASKNNYSGYETIYDALIKSFDIKSSTN